MSKEDLKINPVDQDVTKEDLKKVNGGECPRESCEPDIVSPDELS